MNQFPLPPLAIVEDDLTDTVKIEGTVYARQFFRDLGAFGMRVGAVFQIVSRTPDGALVIKQLERRAD